MTTDEDVTNSKEDVLSNRAPRKVGAALVVVSGAVLTVLSIAAMTGILEDDGGFGWPVYAVLAVASLALMMTGVRNYQSINGQDTGSS